MKIIKTGSYWVTGSDARVSPFFPQHDFCHALVPGQSYRFGLWWNIIRYHLSRNSTCSMEDCGRNLAIWEFLWYYLPQEDCPLVSAEATCKPKIQRMLELVVKTHLFLNPVLHIDRRHRSNYSRLQQQGRRRRQETGWHWKLDGDQLCLTQFPKMMRLSPIRLHFRKGRWEDMATYQCIDQRKGHRWCIEPELNRAQILCWIIRRWSKSIRQIGDKPRVSCGNVKATP